MTRRSGTDDLPPPDPDALEHSGRLVRLIGDRIDEADGRLPFDRYMAMALYAPGLGYYSAGQARFGAGGDYTTAPMMSTLFSRTLARQCAEILDGLPDAEIVEFGAGTGRMAADLLDELGRLGRAPDRYRILEVSADLRQRQAETLATSIPGLFDCIEWIDTLPGDPINGVILANEVMDALPVKRFHVDGDTLREIMVERSENGFALIPSEPTAELVEAMCGLEATLGRSLETGYTGEWCPALSPWTRSVAASLGTGVALLIDYGFPRREYYHPQRHMGTLLCHYRHRAHDDPLFLPGLQDITAFVDFSSAADAARRAGATVAGFNTQAHFLMGAGLPQLLEEISAEDPDRGLELTQQVKPLLFPGEMGERFKVLALTRAYGRPLSGFSLFDHRHRL